MKVQADIGRQGIVIAAVLVLLVAAIAYLGFGYWQGQSAKPSDLAPVRTGSRGTTSKESEHYRQVLQNYNNKNADQAARDGQTYLSVPSLNSVATKPDLLEESAGPVPGPPPAAPPQTPAPPPRSPQVDPEQRKLVDDQVQAMMTNWAASAPGVARVAKVADYVASLSPAPSLHGAPAGSAIGGRPGDLIVPGYALVAAELRTNIDTDESSVTEAFIPAGPYAGARLFAPGYKRLGDSADFTFNAMAWHGRTYKVSAKPVDITTMRSSLKGEVNNRYFSRIIVPSIAMGLAKAGQLYQQSGTQTVVPPLGGIVVTAPESPNGKAVGGAIVGGMAQQAGSVLNHDAAAEPVKQVTVAADTTIGIRFLAPVLSTDEVTGSKTPTSDASDQANRAPVQTAAAQQQLFQAAQQAALQQAASPDVSQASIGYPTPAAPMPNGVTPHIPRQ